MTLTTVFLIIVIVTSCLVTSFMMVSLVWNGRSAVVDWQPQFLRKVVVDDTVHLPSSSVTEQQQQQQDQNLPLRSTNVDIVKLVNNKYKYGRPSNILRENGLLVHMAPISSWGMNEKSNTHGGDDTGTSNDGFTHLSCSIINAHNPHVMDVPYQSPIGYILEDMDTPVQCGFPSDAGSVSSQMKDSEWSGCACLGDNPHKVSKSVWTCMMPSDQLKEVMELSSTVPYDELYNEVVIPKQYFMEALPSGRAILAFFYVKGSPLRESVVETHKNYLSYTNRNSSQTPLLEYDATNKQQPFIEQ